MPEKRNEMALASMIMGILSIVGVCCCSGGLIFGSLAILFALLSRTEKTMTDNARIGLITGSIGLGLSAAAIIGLLGIGLAGTCSGSAHMWKGGMHL